MRVPFRNFAQLGVVPDQDPYDTPINAFSMATNCRFENGKISRGPIFGQEGSLTFSPRNIISFTDPNQLDHVLLTDSTGKVYEWSPTTLTDLTPTTFTPAASVAATKVVQTSRMVYTNRADHTPFFLQKGAAGHFTQLDHYDSGLTWSDGSHRQQFASTWRFRSIVSFGNTLFGINFTDGANLGPTTVRWSNIITDPTLPPPDWAIDNAEGSGGQNILDDAQGELVDGIKLGNVLLVFSDRETYLVELIGGNDIFSFRRLFDAGILTTRCAIENDNKVYVFGDLTCQDIYIVDGTSRQSIATNAVRRHIYSTLVRNEIDRSFVFHNAKLNEIYFCYTSNDPTCAFPYSGSMSAPGCNRAAVFNLNSQTWSFFDLPWVVSMSYANLTSGLTFAEWTVDYDQNIGTYASMDTGAKGVLLTGSNGYTSPTLGTAISPALRSFELFGSTAAAITVDHEATAAVTIRKDMFDLSELQASLRDYKLISSIYVKGKVSGSAPITIQVGNADNPGDLPTWGNPQSTSASSWKLDFNMSARFHALKITYNDFHDFSLSGLDFEVAAQGAR